jgi:hypothetical protein
MKTNKTLIPSLGTNARAVLTAALTYPTAGYQLRFYVISEGEWQYNRLTNKLEKCGKAHGVPIIEREESATFDAWLIGQIAQGFVTISCGDSHYFKELHRATGRPMPQEPQFQTEVLIAA